MFCSDLNFILFIIMYKLLGITCSHFISGGSGDLLLATCSQDTFVRLWRVQETSTDRVPGDAEELTVKENVFSFSCHGNNHTFSVALEAVLIGHEDWVYSVDWHPPIVKGWWGTGLTCSHTHTHRAGEIFPVA